VTSFKPRRSPGKQFRPKPAEGCSWCIDRKPPQDGQTICEKCVAGFKLLLQSRDWQNYAKAFLYRNPDCACGCNRPATEVDHIKGWRTHPHLFWDSNNHQSLFRQCHQGKTNEEAAALHRSLPQRRR
jgi:5-methylcytosine-specific restriction protein A